MLLDHADVRPVFRKLSRQLSKLGSKSAPDAVHKFRTSSRRVEVLVTDLAQERSRNDKKLLKLLDRLRKKSGRVRDLDVEIAALRSLKIPQEPARKSRLMRTLAEERANREKKLIKVLNKKTIAEVRKRLKRTAGTLEIPGTTNPVEVAMRKITELEVGNSAVSEQTLHSFRLASKRARYIAEMAGHDAEGMRLVEQLKRMQDAIGDWHDWEQLARRAEKLYGGAQDSALVAALRNVTRAKFRQAVNVLTETRSTLTGKKRASVTTVRPGSLPHPVPDTAVA